MIALSATALEFVSDRHLATLTTLRANGSPHVVPVGFTFDVLTGAAWVICGDGGVKVRNLERSLPGSFEGQIGGRAVLCQVDGGRWISLEGIGRVHRDAAVVAEAARRYEVRYQPPRPNPNRVALEIMIDRVLDRSAGPGARRAR
jgi:F420H(2)-dependent biliverdin reductase